MEKLPPLVLDFGSGVCKVGFAGKLFPGHVYQSCVQQQETLINKTRVKRPPIYVGNEDLKHGYLNYPIEHGIVTDWDNVQKIWWHGFDLLYAKPGYHTLLITESPLNPRSNRTKIAEIMFEENYVPALYFANTAKMCAESLDPENKFKHLILELGYGVTSAVPVIHGYPITSCAQRNDFGGRELAKYFRKLLDDNQLNDWKGFSCEERFSKKSGLRDTAGMAMEGECYVAMDLKKEMAKNILTQPYDVEVRNSIDRIIKLQIGPEKFYCPEALFDPTRLALSAKGIHELTVNAISKCDACDKDELYDRITVCGVNAQFPNLDRRLEKEISNLVNREVHVSATTYNHCAWIGAARFASSKVHEFEKLCTTKLNYEENGPQHLHDRAEQQPPPTSETFKHKLATW